MPRGVSPGEASHSLFGSWAARTGEAARCAAPGATPASAPGRGGNRGVDRARRPDHGLRPARGSARKWFRPGRRPFRVPRGRGGGALRPGDRGRAAGRSGQRRRAARPRRHASMRTPAGGRAGSTGVLAVRARALSASVRGDGVSRTVGSPALGGHERTRFVGHRGGQGGGPWGRPPDRQDVGRPAAARRRRRPAGTSRAPYTTSAAASAGTPSAATAAIRESPRRPGRSSSTGGASGRCAAAMRPGSSLPGRHGAHERTARRRHGLPGDASPGKPLVLDGMCPADGGDVAERPFRREVTAPPRAPVVFVPPDSA